MALVRLLRLQAAMIISSLILAGCSIETAVERLRPSADPGLPEISFSTLITSVNENAGTLTVQVDLTNTAKQTSAVTVGYAASSGTAQLGVLNDFNLAAGTLTFAVGETSKSFNISVNDDNISETAEDFTVALTSPVGGVILSPGGLMTVSINDNDGLPTVNFASAIGSTNETTASGDIVVNLSNPSSQAIVVTYTTAVGTAATPADYTLASGTLTFAAGVTSYSLHPTIANDVIAEGAETFNVSLTAVSATATLGAVLSHTHTINDDESTPTVYFQAATASANENVGTQNVVLVLSGVSSSNVVVTLLASGTAADPADYTLAATTVTVPAGQTTATVGINVVDDAAGEPAETVILDINTVTGGSVTEGTPGQHTFTINASDVPVINYAVGTGSVAENVVGGTIDIVVNLSNAAVLEVTVNYDIQGASTAGIADYTFANGTLTFAAGETTKTLTVAIIDDNKKEADETLILNLNSASANAAVGTTNPVHTLTILDNEAAPTVDFSVGTSSAGEAAGTATLTVQLNRPSYQIITIGYLVTGTATQGALQDYTLDVATLTFLEDELSKTITVTINDDAVVEVSETAILTLSGPVNATVGTTFPSHTLTITDNDSTAFTWVGTAGDGKWSTGANWLGGVVPGPSDTALFSNICGANCNVTTDQVVDISGLNMASDYTGTITQGAYNFTVGSNGWTHASGSFVAHSVNTLQMNGAYNQSGGSMTLNGANLTVTKNFTHAAGSFAVNSSLVVFDYNGTTNNTITPGAAAFGNVKFTHNGGGYSIHNISGTMLVGGNLTLDALGTTPGAYMMGGQIDLSGNLTIDSWPAVGGSDTTVIRLVGPNPQTITGGAAVSDAVPSLYIDTASTVSLVGRIGIVRDFIVTNGALNAGTSSVWFVGNTPATINVGTQILNDVGVDIYGSSSSNDLTIVGNLDINGNLSIENNLNTQTVDGGTITLAGNLTVSDVSGGGTAAITLDGAGTQTITQVSGSFPEGKITVNKSGGTVELASHATFAATQDMDLLAGTINMNNFNLGIQDVLNMSAGTVINKGCGNLTYNAGASTINGTINGGTVSPNISIADATAVTEGSNLQFVISLNAPVCGSNVVVNYKTLDNTAYAHTDYSYASGTATVLTTKTTTTISVTTRAESEDELDETMILDISSPSTGTIVDAQGMGTILDNDVASTYFWTGNAFPDTNWTTNGNWSGGVAPNPSQIAIFDGSCVHCNATINNPTMNIYGIRMRSTFSGTLTQAPGANFSVGQEGIIQEGGSFIGSDANISILGTYGYLRIMGGTFQSTSATLSTVETIQFNHLAATFLHNNGTVEITGDCGCSAGDQTIVGQFTFWDFKQSRTNGSTGFLDNVVIENDFIRTGGGTFGAGIIDLRGDYINSYGTWSSGQNPIHFKGLGDQYISQTLTTPPNYSYEGIVPSIVVNKTSGSVIQQTDILFDGSAWASHLQILSGTWKMAGHNLTLADTDDNLTIGVGAVLDKGCGILTVNGTLVNNGTITDGGAPTASFSISDATATAETNAGTINHNFVVTMAAPVCAETTVQYQTADGFATAGSDYTAIGLSTLTFAAGETTKTITVQSSGDTTPEGNETFYVNLSNASGGGAITDTQGVGTINNDDVSGNVWTGLAGDGNWSNNGNWADNSKPAGGETAYFVPGTGACVPGPACDATINEPVTISSIQILNGFSGVVTNSNHAITLTGELRLTGGSLNTGTSTLTFNSGWLTVLGGTHNFDTSHFLLDGSGSRTFTPGTETYGSLDISRGSGWGTSIVGTWSVLGDLALSAAGLSLGGTIEVGGDVTSSATIGTETSSAWIKLVGIDNAQVSAGVGYELPNLEIIKNPAASVNFVGEITYRGSFLYTSGITSASGSHMIFKRYANQTITSNGFMFDDVSINQGGGWATSINTDMTVLGDLTFDSPGFSLTTSTSSGINVYGNLVFSGAGAVQGGTSYVQMAGIGSQIIDGHAGVSLSNLKINKTGGSLTLQDTIDLRCNFEHIAGTVVPGTSTVRFVPANCSKQVIPNTALFNNVEMLADGGYNFNITGTLVVGGLLTINQPSAQVNGGTIEAKGDINLTNLEINSTSALLLTGSAEQTLSRTLGNWPSGAVTVNKTGGFVRSGSALSFVGGSQDLLMTQGTWNMNGYDLTVADQLTMAAGTVINKGCNTLTVNGVNVPAGPYGVGGTINGGSGSPTIAVADATVVEGSSAAVVVSLSAPYCLGNMTVNYATSLGSADPDRDYSYAGGVLTFAAGQVSKTISVNTTADTYPEASETFLIDLSSPSIGSLTDAQALVTITDNDTAIYKWTGLAGDGKWSTPGNWLGNVVPSSDTENGSPAVFDNTCTNCNATIDVNTSVGGIYIMPSYSGTITQASGATLTTGKAGFVQHAGNFVGGDANITMGANYGSHFTRIIGGSFTSTSANLNMVYTFGVNTPAATFLHNGGSVNFVGDCGCAAQRGYVWGDVVFNNLNITRHGTLEIQNSARILGNLIVNSTGDAALNGPGTIYVEGNVDFIDVGSAGGYVDLNFQGANNQTIANSTGQRIASITVAKSGGVVSQNSSLDSTYSAGRNFTFTSGTWNMNSYNLTMSGSLTMAAGTVINKGCSTLTMNGVNIPAGPYGSGTITGGFASPSFSIADATAAFETNSGTINHNFIVTNTAPVCAQTTVQYQTADGFATAGSDYTAIGLTTLSFASGETTKTMSVTVSGDTTPEGNETFYVNLSNASGGGVITDNQGVGTINNDDVSGNVWTGLAGDNNWSNNGNWADNSKPTVGEIAYFVPGGCVVGPACDATINENINIDGLHLLIGYGGTITQDAYTVDVGGSSLRIESGNFAGSGTAVTLSGLQVLGGTLDMSSATYTLNGSMEYKAGTINAGTSLFKFGPGGGWKYATLDVPLNLYNMEFLSWQDVTGTSRVINVANNLVLNAITANENFSGADIRVAKDFTITGFGAGGIANTSTITLNGNGVQNVTGDPGADFGGLIIQSTGTVNLNGTINMRARFDYVSGVVNSGTSTVRFIGSGWGTFNSTTGLVFNNLEYNKPGSSENFTGVFVVGGNLVIDSAGAGAAGGGELRALKDVTVLGGVTPSSTGYKIKLAGTGVQNFTSAIGRPIGDLIIDATGTINLIGGLDIYGEYTYTNGTLNPGTSHVRFMKQNWSQWITSSAGAPLYDVSIMIGGAGAYSTFLSGVLNVTNDLTITNSTHNLAGGEYRVGRNLILNSSASGGTSAITLVGSGDQTVTENSGTWPGGTITVNKSAGRVVQGTNVNFNTIGQDLVFAQAGTWDMAGHNLTVNDQVNGSAGVGTIYRGCGSFTRGSIVPTINEVGGTYGVGISIADAANVTEEDVADVNQSFVISVSPQNCAATTFKYATQNGTATAPADYTAIAATDATIPANTTSITVTVVTKADDLYEANENYTVQLSNLMAGVAATDVVGQGVILDDDATSVPTLSIADINVTEGASAQFVVTLSQASGQNVVFDWATSNGTAIAGSDYTAGGETLRTIAAGQTTYTLPGLATTVDGPDSPETFTVSLSNVSNVAGAGNDFVATAVINEAGPAELFRSVGPNNTTPLATGTGNNLTISGTTATFDLALPNNVGVGDAIQYDSDNDGNIDAVAFISGRTSNTVYLIKNSVGSLPVATTTGDQDWSVLRAYTSLNNFNNGTENSGLDVAIKDFDAHTINTNKNLVTLNRKINIALYADATESEWSVAANNWATDATRFLRFYTPYLSSEVGVSQRHNGTLTGGGYRLRYLAGGNDLVANYSIFDGIIFEAAETGAFRHGNNCIIRNNIFVYTGAAAATGTPKGLENFDSNSRVKVYNNIFMNFKAIVGGSPVGFALGVGYATSGAHIYNNTIVNSYRAISTWENSVVYLRNNIIQNVDVLYTSSTGATISASSNHNIFNTGTTFGANDVISSSVKFVDPDRGDYRLSVGDFIAKGTGADLSADPNLAFSTDMLNANRTAPWDRGATNAMGPVPIYRSVGPGNTAILAQGSSGPNNLTISGSLATFVSDLPNKIGVGDVIVYDCNASGGLGAGDCLAFIHQRVSATQFYVANSSGGVPTSFAADQDWRIYRAYADSRSAMGKPGNDPKAGAENPFIVALDATLGNFDNFIGGKDIVAANEQWNYAMYADAVETLETEIWGWVTSPTHYIRVYTPYLANEVGVSQRHNGVWGTGFRLQADGGFGSYHDAVFEGLSVLSTNRNSISFMGGTRQYVFGNLLGEVISDTTQGTQGITGGSADMRIVNNIIYGHNDTFDQCIEVGGATNQILVYNNTFVDCMAIHANDSNAILKNNIVQNGVGDWYVGTISASSTNNLSSGATAPGSNPQVNKTVQFMNAANKDYRLAPADAFAKNVGANLLNDSLHRFGWDFASTARGTEGVWDIGAHEAATAIYRSVGPGNTTCLARGAGAGCTLIGNLTISGGNTATFAAAMPDNFGVGDAIQYATTGTTINAIAFVTGRVSSKVFKISSVSGGSVTNLAAFTSWEAYRAYTSLADAEYGAENTGIDAAVRNFDTWNSGYDLLPSNLQWNITLYGDATDTAAFNFNDWKTGPQNYLKAYTPTSLTEVGVSQRHSGYFDATKYNRTTGFSIRGSAYVHVDGMQIDLGALTAWESGILLENVTQYTDVLISNNILLASSGGDGSTKPLGTWNSNSPDATVRVWNNFIKIPTTIDCVDIDGINAYVYNNTIIGGSSALSASGNFVAKNNIAQGAASTNYIGTFATGSTNNLAADASAPGLNPQNNKTVTFINAAAGDYRLSLADTTAKYLGANLSADTNIAFATDLAGVLRSTPWDIGASKAMPNYLSLSGLLGLWPLDETSGSFMDLSGYGYNGTNQGSATYSNPGVLGTSVGLNGSSSYIQLPNASAIASGLSRATGMGWMYLNNLPSTVYLMSFSRNGHLNESRFSIEIQPGGSVRLIGRDTDTTNYRYCTTAAGVVLTGVWVHVTGVVDYQNDVCEIYINGANVASTKSGTAISQTAPGTTSDRSSFGAQDDGSAGFLNGRLDELSFWGRNLSATEIADAFNKQRRLPTVNISDVTLAEGVSAEPVVTLTEAVSWPVVFNWATSDGTADRVADAFADDYTASSGTATIAAGALATTLSIVTLDDTVDEPNQYFSVTLSSVQNATDGDLISVVTLTDNDSAPTLSINDDSDTEAGGTHVFTLTQSAYSEQEITYDYATANVTATAGSDYTAISGTVTVAARSLANTTYTVSIINDTTACEPPETYSIDLNNVINAATGDFNGSGAITENDWPSLTVAGAVAREGSDLIFTATLSQVCPNNNISATFITSGGSAVPNMDFTTTEVVASFSAGQTISSFSVPTIDDASVETNEYMTVWLNSFVNLDPTTIVSSTGVIEDNDAGASVRVKRIASGGQHACALLSDNSVKCIGRTQYGELGFPPVGYGVEGGRYAMGDNVPYLDLGAGRTAIQMALGSNFGCVLLDNGKVKCWGDNGAGQAGVDNSVNQNMIIGDAANEVGDSVPVVDLGVGYVATQVSAGTDFACAILNTTESSKLKCWGQNATGQLGYGNTEDRNLSAEMGTKLPFVDLGTGRSAKVVRTGNNFTCAILDNDKVKCWGDGASGRLGSGNTGDIGDSPNEMGDNLPYVDLGTVDGLGITPHTAKDIALGDSHVCVILNDDRLKCWGEAGSGQIGLGTNVDRGDAANEMGDFLPYVDVGTGRTVKQIAAGGWASTCALLDNDNTVCWGEAGYGQLGRGSVVNIGDGAGEMGNALTVVDFGGGVKAHSIAAYGASFCARLNNANQDLKCWGDNVGGELGQGDLNNRGDQAGEMGTNLLPINLGSGGNDKVSLMSVSGNVDDNICVILNDGRVKCWGKNWTGSLGLGHNYVGDLSSEMGANLVPADIGSGTVIDVVAGTEFSCALFVDGKVKCWGYNNLGQLGLGDTTLRAYSSALMGNNLPFVSLGTGLKVKKIASGDVHSCVIFEDGRVKCWGEAANGRLGYGNSNDLGNDPGEMGDALPFVDLGAGRTAIDISAGNTHTCAVLDNYKVKCWGSGVDGKLGYGNTSDRGNLAAQMGDNLPYVELGTGKLAVQVNAGFSRTCALLTTGEVKCWGDAYSGELGIGSNVDRGDNANEMGDFLPAIDFGTGRKAIALARDGAHADHACVLLDNQQVKCWGYNPYGQVGIGSVANKGNATGEMGDKLPFVNLGTARTAADISLGNDFTCATLDNGDAKCWGRNEWGNLGQGDLNHRGDQPNEMGDNLPAIDFYGTPANLGAFAISGVTGGSDNITDAWLGNLAATVHWSASTNATSYKVTVLENDLTTVKCAEQTTVATSYNFAGCTLTDGAVYALRVIADDGSTTRAATNQFMRFTVDVTAPAAFSVLGITADVDVTNDAILADGQFAIVNWQNSTGATNYNITIYENDGTTIKCATTNVTGGSIQHSFLGCALTNGLNYKVKLEALDAVGNLTQATNSLFTFNVNDGLAPQTFAISGVTGGYDTTVDNQLSSGTLATIQWTDAASESYYDLTIYENDGVTVKCATVTLPQNSVVHTFETCQLSVGLSYKIGLVAWDAFTNTPATNNLYTFSVTSSGAQSFAILGVRGGSDVTSDNQLTSGNTPNIYWQAAVNATSYDVAVYDSANTSVVCASVNTAATNYNFSSCYLRANTAYKIRVRANNISGNVEAINQPFAFTVGNYPTLTLSNPTVTEGGNLVFNATLSAAWTEDVVFSWKVVPVSATMGIDYTYASGTVTITTGNTTDTTSIVVPTLDDSLDELDDKVIVSAFRPSNVQVSSSSIATGTIIDNDVGNHFIRVETGINYSCAIQRDGNVKCWGIRSTATGGGALVLGAAHVGWAANEMGDNLPALQLPTATSAVSVAVGTRTNCVLLNNNNVVCLGSDFNKALGASPGANTWIGDLPGDMGDSLTQLNFGQAVSELVGAGQSFCVRLADNTIKCWGSNGYGQLGIGSVVDKYVSETSTVNLGTGHTAKAIAMGKAYSDTHVCAILNDNRVKCWGSGSLGQLGYEDVVSRGDGAGEMGDNLPYVNLGTGHTAKSIVSGGGFNCVILNDDRVKCWGANGDAQLGVGNTNSYGHAVNTMGDNLPYVNLGAGRTAKKLTAGYRFVCAILDNDRVKCWGEGASGQLGNENTTNLGDAAGEMGDNLPYVDLGLDAGLQPNKAAEVAAGSSHTCVRIMTTNALKCFGYNYYGQLGLGNTTYYGSVPNTMGSHLPDVNLGTGVVAQSLWRAGGYDANSTCIITATGALKCWGYNLYGQLGLMNHAIGDEPLEMGASLASLPLPNARTAVDFSLGDNHACLTLSDGTQRCLGENGSYELGLGLTATQLSAFGWRPGQSGDAIAPVYNDNSFSILKSEAGVNFTCTLFSNYKMKCLGDNGNGQLGLGDVSDRGLDYHLGQNLPFVDLGQNRYVLNMSASVDHVCALLDNFEVKCWGSNIRGQLGYGDTVQRGDNPNEMGDFLPNVSLGTGVNAIAVSAGVYMSCAILDNLKLKCWGDDLSGQLGIEASGDRGDGANEMGDNLPVLPFGAGVNVLDIKTSVYSNIVCGLLDASGTKQIKCWGAGTFGRLGQGSTASRGAAVGDISGMPAIQLGTGRTPVGLGRPNTHVCVIMDNGKIKCWGNNSYGQLGLGDRNDRGDAGGEMGDSLPQVDLNY